MALQRETLSNENISSPRGLVGGEVLSDNNELTRQRLAIKFVEAFGGEHITPSRTMAAKILTEMPPLDDIDRTQFIEKALRAAGDDINREVVIGVVEDYRTLYETFAAYVVNLGDKDPEVARIMQLDDKEEMSSDIWSKDQENKADPVFPAPELSTLVRTFDTQDEDVRGIGLETAMIAGAITLADLMTTPYHDVAAYKKALFAKNFLVPICSVIGLDALESALNDQVAIIQGRNIGDDNSDSEQSRDIDPLMDETDRMISLHFGRRDDDRPERFDFATGVTQGIVRQLIGEPELKSAVGVKAPHGMFFQVGSVGEDLQLRVRGKGRGSYLYKLMKNLGYYDSRLKPLNEHDDTAPIDVYGITVIARDNNRLAEVYTEAVARALSAEDEAGKITPYPAPSRQQAFVVKGPADFQELIKQKIKQKIPDVDMDRFSFKDSHSGFTDAKITGFYQTGDARVPFAPFEMQFSTPDARLVARIDKRAAHFIYKLASIYGEEVVEMDEATAKAIKNIWKRKQDHFNNRNEQATEADMTPQTKERVKAYEQRRSLQSRLAEQALRGV